MKIRRVTEKEIDNFIDVLDDLNDLRSELEYKNISNVNFNEYKFLNKINLDEMDNDDVLLFILKLLTNNNYKVILFNLLTLLDNCVDSDSTTLEFNKDITKGLKLLNIMIENNSNINEEVKTKLIETMNENN